jgi:hypothetical protein
MAKRPRKPELKTQATSASPRERKRVERKAAARASKATPRGKSLAAPAGSKTNGSGGPAHVGTTGDFLAAVTRALHQHEPDGVPDTVLQDVMAAAIQLYAAKAERREVAPFRKDKVTATEAVVAACALIRAADLNLFDVAMWFNRAAALA